MVARTRWRIGPRVGVLQKAPDFTATAVVGGGEYKQISLSDFKGKYVVLFFYPLDFTFVCPTEIMEFSRRAPEFREINTQIIGVSCDSHYSHKTWLDQLGELEYPLVSDFSKQIARDYEVLLSDGFPTRATFIIDPERTIQHASFNNPNVGRSVTEVLRVLEAVQTQALCPVEWKRGDKTL